MNLPKSVSGSLTAKVRQRQDNAQGAAGIRRIAVLKAGLRMEQYYFNLGLKIK